MNESHIHGQSSFQCACCSILCASHDPYSSFLDCLNFTFCFSTWDSHNARPVILIFTAIYAASGRLCDHGHRLFIGNARIRTETRWTWLPHMKQFELASILSEFGQELLGDFYTPLVISSISNHFDRYALSTTRTTTAGGKSRKKKQQKQARKSNTANTNMKLCQMGWTISDGSCLQEWQFASVFARPFLSFLQSPSIILDF